MMQPRTHVELTSAPATAIKTLERATASATSQQVPGVSPGRRVERITSPRLPPHHAWGDHEARASQVVGRSALSPERSAAGGATDVAA
jgi:hypothetical protein